jgi:putative ABC transport system permease protein
MDASSTLLRCEAAMLQNYLAAALRNLVRNRLYAAINISGLAVGFAAAILIGLYVRDEYSYDRFFPDYAHIFRVELTITLPGRPPMEATQAPSDVAQGLRLDFPGIDTTVRLVRTKVVLRRARIEGAVSTAIWADPDFFRLFPMKVVAGEALDALSRPENIVLTRSVARRFFDREDVVGETIELNHTHTMRVAAVIEDLPSNTHLAGDVFLPAVASFSEITRQDAIHWGAGRTKSFEVYTYVRLQPGIDVAAINAGLRGFVSRHLSGDFGGVPLSQLVSRVELAPIAAAHLEPRHLDSLKPEGDPLTLRALMGVAALILLIAGSNFVSMMTARALQRAVEVGVRRAVGATRRQLIAQFMGECLLYALAALVLAMLAVDLLLPAFNAFVQRDIRFDFLRDPTLGAAILGSAVLVGIAAGAYPSLVLSQFRAAVVLRGTAMLAGGSGPLRRAVVVFQFATLVALIVATATIESQTRYALQERLSLPGGSVYVQFAGCSRSFTDEVAKLRGVVAASCASSSAVAQSHWLATFTTHDERQISIEAAMIDDRFFELLGVHAIAGRLLSQERGEDDLLRAGSATPRNPALVLNESAARELGYAEPQAAVGQYQRWSRPMMLNGGPAMADSASSRIVGIVPDFSLGSVRDVVEPTVYYIDPAQFNYALLLRLDGGRIPETLAAVRQLWERQGTAGALQGMFLDQYLQDLYSDILRQLQISAVFSSVSVLLAALGLLGLAAFTAERRTREIGLRKVMGASRLDILRFLGWQFARPVLWANLIAWPCAYFAMRRWLQGFAYHVELSPAPFLAAGALALAIALATVAAHAFLVARAKPVDALRYE